VATTRWSSSSIIQAYANNGFSHERLDDVLTLYADKTGFAPKAILIDGFDWERGTIVERAAEIKRYLKQSEGSNFLSDRRGAEEKRHSKAPMVT